MDPFIISIFDIRWKMTTLTITFNLRLFHGAQIQFFLPPKDYFTKVEKN